MLHVTLLASGFVIGPRGTSIRDICNRTNTDIRSWTENGLPRPVRVFVIAGARTAVTDALDIICQAVDRYKALCEGALAGRCVTRQQHVAGIDFMYQPPPRAAVPHAAALRGTFCPMPRRATVLDDGRTASAPLPPALRVQTVEPTRSLDLSGLLYPPSTNHWQAPTPANTMLPDMATAALLQVAGSLQAALGGTGLGGLLALSPSDGSEAAAGAPGAGLAEQQLSHWLSGVLPEDVVDKGCIASRSLSAPLEVRWSDRDKTSWGM